MFLQPTPTPFVDFDFSTIDWKVILAALAIIVALVLALYFQWWRSRKRLSYEILSNVLVVSADEEVQDQVEIRYKGVPVTNVRLMVIKLINDGYQPIKKEDFQGPIRFVFSGAKVLFAERVKLHPENLDIETSYFPSRVDVGPTLFNRKDYLQFKVLLSGDTGMKIDARIVGVSKVGKVSRRLTRPEALFALGAVIITVMNLLTITTYAEYIKLGAVFVAMVLVSLVLVVTKYFKD